MSEYEKLEKFNQSGVSLNALCKCGLLFSQHGNQTMKPDGSECEKFEKWAWQTDTYAGVQGVYHRHAACECGCIYSLHDPDLIHGPCKFGLSFGIQPQKNFPEETPTKDWFPCACEKFKPAKHLKPQPFDPNTEKYTIHRISLTPEQLEAVTDLPWPLTITEEDEADGEVRS